MTARTITVRPTRPPAIPMPRRGIRSVAAAEAASEAARQSPQEDIEKEGAAYQTLYEALVTTHGLLAWVLYAVVALHVAAALKHHFMLRDDVLRRMLPFTSTPGGKP